MPAKPKNETVENALSLIYRGALPDILRLIADQLESGHARAEHFTAKVSRETFDLSTTINLKGGA